MPVHDTDSPTNNGAATITEAPDDLLRQVQADAALLGEDLPVEPFPPGAIGATMFDLPGSEDHSLTVLLPQLSTQRAPSQALVRIHSRGDGRTYLGIVTAGPFAEPDALRADSHLLVTVSTHGGIYLPPYHGRVQIAVLGEELADGTLVPPRLRPLPNSPVVVLSDVEAARVLRTEGDIRLGLVVGYDAVPLQVPSTKKDVLPRHTAILGTTGGGKSTTVARLAEQARAAGMAVILLDVEGEYTHLHEPATDAKMLAALAERGIEPAGIPAADMALYHLVGRDTANPEHPHVRPFSLQFAWLSPYAAVEILGLSDAQELRFFEAYDLAKQLVRDLGIFPEKCASPEERAKQERIAAELDEFERGYPRLTLALLMDVVAACHLLSDRGGKDKPRARNPVASEVALPALRPGSPILQTPEGMSTLRTRLHSSNITANAISWRALLGRLGRLSRLRVFDTPRARPLSYKQLLRPGALSVIDLSDSGVSELNNLVIADLLRGVQQAQEKMYRDHERGKDAAVSPPRVLLIIEEAHEFLSSERRTKLDALYQQVARVAKRGRKRWLGLVFVTQLPQHLPPALFGLVNSYVLHKISDPQVVHTLQRTVSGIDAGLWSRLPGLAPGQAIVSFPHLSRPLLVAVDPAPAKLRLVD